MAWKNERHPAWFFRFVQWTLSPLVRFTFATRRVNHKSIPKKGPVILVSNHCSNIDPVLVVVSMRRTVYHLGKHTLFKSWPTRFFFGTLGGQIPVDRERGGNLAAVNAAVRVLETGRALGIYPEGRRSPDGKLCRGRTGVARLALLTGAPVYPVAIEGTHRIWPKGKTFPRLFRRTRVIVGAPRQYPKDPEHADDPRRAREITDEIMMDLARLLGQDDYDPKTAPLLGI